MRLINVEKFIATDIVEFEEFFEADVPPYAILSHRWGSQELTYKEVAKRRCDRNKSGYEKVKSACVVAAGYNLAYVWCDTCCINKDSSAELTEAINSMFKWYQNSQICLAYLSDVHTTAEDIKGGFEKSDWFNRAWTLQELIAPKQITFFDKHWTDVGGKSEKSTVIESITNIPADLLRGESSASDFAHGAKMYWASKRVATRIEDIAYSLLGIFNVNMPPLYGEGANAFVRLQEELIRHSQDLTFLYWGARAPFANECKTHNLLAKSPADFERTPKDSHWFLCPSLQLTNLGLSIKGSFVRWAPLTYALLLTEHLDQCAGGFLYRYPCALLIRRCSITHRYYNIGTCAFEVNLKDWTWVARKTKTIDIVRQHWNEGLVKPQADKTPSNLVFSVIFGTTVTGTIQKTRRSANRPDHCIWAWHGQELHCKFKVAKLIDTANMRCTTRRGSVFYIDLTFDFDGHSCVLFSRQETKVSSWQASERLKDDENYEGNATGLFAV